MSLTGSASSTSTPRYRTVLSNFVCPRVARRRAGCRSACRSTCPCCARASASRTNPRTLSPAPRVAASTRPAALLGHLVPTSLGRRAVCSPPRPDGASFGRPAVASRGCRPFVPPCESPAVRRGFVIPRLGSHPSEDGHIQPQTFPNVNVKFPNGRFFFQICLGQGCRNRPATTPIRSRTAQDPLWYGSLQRREGDDVRHLPPLRGCAHETTGFPPCQHKSSIVAFFSNTGLNTSSRGPRALRPDRR